MRRLAALLVVIIAFRVEAQKDRERRAWEWTNDERVAKRMTMTIKTPSSETRYRVDGNTNPELLFPLELFQWLIARIEEGGPSLAGAKRHLAPLISHFGWEDRSFWQQLETVTSRYRELEEQSQVLDYEASSSAPAARRRVEGEIDKVRSALCPARVAALEDARRVFGARFDEFLFAGVAPGLASSSSGNEETYRRTLRIMSGVCE